MSYSCELRARSGGKTMSLFKRNLDMLISQYQKKTDTVQKMTIMVSESLYEDLKKIPETFFHGRWLYYRHEKTKSLVLIKKVNIVLPKGFKTLKYTRIEGELKPL